MTAIRSTAWLQKGLTLLAAVGVLTLSACGGGSGAPNNPYEPSPPTPTLMTVVPDEATAYPGTPLVLSIQGGTPPYTAFSANPAALPVPATISGNTLTVLANNVDSAQAANITIRDSGGQIAVSEITVRPAVLSVGSITITPNSVPCDTEACSGQTSVAVVRATGSGGAPLVGRQVRFDVVQGQFSLQTTNPGSPLQATQTVVTDSQGDARVIIAVPPNTPTQIGLLRATDVASGNQVTGQFVITQVTAGEGVLSVAPNGAVTITGPVQGVCSSGVRVSFYIFGGTPPYRVVTNFPDAVTLMGTPVLTNGGGFDIVTNGTCFTNLSFAITDATGRTLTTNLPTVTNQQGTTPPPAPVALSISPASVSVDGTTAQPCNSTNRTYQFVVNGGTPPYSAFLSPSSGWTNGGFTNNVLTVSGPGNTTVTISDSGGATTTATITCTMPP